MAELYYLVSSLPDLSWEAEPAFGSERFLALCNDWLSEGEKNTLTTLSLQPPAPCDHSDYFAAAPQLKTVSASVASAWYRWETALRNRLVKQRAAAGQDPARMLHGESELVTEIENGVTEAWNQTDPMERERVLDRMRWRFLDELENHNTFNFGYLCIYRLKLLLKEKWQPRQRDAGRAKLEQILATVLNNRTQKPVGATA